MPSEAKDGPRSFVDLEDRHNDAIEKANLAPTKPPEAAKVTQGDHAAANAAYDAMAEALGNRRSVLVRAFARHREEAEKRGKCEVPEGFVCMHEFTADNAADENTSLRERLVALHEAMADVMVLRRASANQRQRDKAEFAISVWREVQSFLSNRGGANG